MTIIKTFHYQERVDRRRRLRRRRPQRERRRHRRPPPPRPWLRGTSPHRSPASAPPPPPPEERRGPGQRPPLAGSRPAPAVGCDDARARAQVWANRGAAHLLRNSSTPASIDRIKFRLKTTCIKNRKTVSNFHAESNKVRTIKSTAARKLNSNRIESPNT